MDTNRAFLLATVATPIDSAYSIHNACPLCFLLMHTTKWPSILICVRGVCAKYINFMTGVHGVCALQSSSFVTMSICSKRYLLLTVLIIMISTCVCIILCINSTGPWLQKVLGDMKGKANGTLDQMKLFLYSAVSLDTQ